MEAEAEVEAETDAEAEAEEGAVFHSITYQLVLCTMTTDSLLRFECFELMFHLNQTLYEPIHIFFFLLTGIFMIRLLARASMLPYPRFTEA